MELSPESLRGYLEYLRDLGMYDLYRSSEPSTDLGLAQWLRASAPTLAAVTGQSDLLNTPSNQVADSGRLTRQQTSAQRTANPITPSLNPRGGPDVVMISPVKRPTIPSSSPAKTDSTTYFEDTSEPAGAFQPPSMPLVSFNQLAPLPLERVAPKEKAAALQRVREIIGDCTRCPLAYAGRHTIVFADGDPNAQLMFVGEGPGADEDESGVPFVGKAGQLLNNMIGAMGLKREQVYIANVVKCRPPKNRVPEPVEANTCSPFLLQQIDIVQPKVVALGATAATYLLGVRQPLNSLRGRWHEVRGAKCAVTYHPAFLLRDPRQKGEAWKDLQRVMTELDLKPPIRS